MMHQLKIGQIPLPAIYIVQGKSEVDAVRKRGIPYIVKPRGWSDDKLVKAVLFNTLVQKFPHIKWTEVLHMTKRTADQVEVVTPVTADYRCTEGEDPFDIAPDESMQQTDGGEYRPSDGGFDGDNPDLCNDPGFDHLTIDEFIGDTLYHVSIEELQALHCLPVFLDDIADAIRQNLIGTEWMAGWNKKLQCDMGRYQLGQQARNLIIVDVSGSIPSGVAGTMVTLCETMRSQCDADLIITGNRSWWYPNGEPLPSPDRLRATIGGCNECVQFYKILREHVIGRHWGNIIVFGDQDAPEDSRFSRDQATWLKPEDAGHNTQVDNLLAYHTYKNVVPGYGLWVETLCPGVNTTVNNEWCKCMTNR